MDNEEIVSRMTDEELLGLTPPDSRPSSGLSLNRLGKTNLAALVGKAGSRPPSSGSRCPSTADMSKNEGTRLGGLAHSHSAPAVGTLRPCSAAEVKAQRKESFHFKRQRRWLEIRNKQHCLSFTEQEISDFRRFFNALTKGKETLRLDQFEDMLVCLDLAKSRKDIRAYMEVIQDHVVDRQINFPDFLKTFESQLDGAEMVVLKQLLQGSYDSRDLDFPTFISERRRELILNATGARGSVAKGTSSQIVRTFADLLEDRCYSDFGPAGSNNKSDDGVLLMGGLGTMWNVACVQHGLARTLTAEERTAQFKKSTPLSPRTVVNNIVKAAGPRTLGVHRMGHTMIIEADKISA